MFIELVEAKEELLQQLLPLRPVESNVMASVPALLPC